MVIHRDGIILWPNLGNDMCHVVVINLLGFLGFAHKINEYGFSY